MPLTTDEELLTLSHDIIERFDKVDGGVHPGFNATIYLALRKLDMAGDGISGARWMPLHRMLARDRRLAAIHEGGHYVIARWAGIRSVQAFLKQSGTDDPRTEHTWIGQTHYSRPEIDRLSERRRMMLAVAGACAEKVNENTAGRRSTASPWRGGRSRHRSWLPPFANAIGVR